MLGNGSCARLVDLNCQFESMCESCTFVQTTIEFRPILEEQHDDDDAAAKGQADRKRLRGFARVVRGELGQPVSQSGQGRGGGS